MVRHHDVGRLGTNLLATLDVDPPHRVQPGVERCPAAGEAVQCHQAAVPSIRHANTDRTITTGCGARRYLSSALP